MTPQLRPPGPPPPRAPDEGPSVREIDMEVHPPPPATPYPQEGRGEIPLPSGQVGSSRGETGSSVLHAGVSPQLNSD